MRLFLLIKVSARRYLYQIRPNQPLRKSLYKMHLLIKGNQPQHNYR